MAIENAITTAVQLKLGFGLPGPFQQVMYIKHACFGPHCGYAALADSNSWMSVFQGDYYKDAGVQMHEIGHNFGLAHSGMGQDTYADHTCLMGNPLYSDTDGSMCFNPAKSWQLGWYSPFYEDVYVGAGQEWEGKLIGVSDYKNNPNSDKIVLRIETDTQDDYFVGFNRATGSNSDNDLCDNCVTVIKTGNNGESYSQSWNQINPQGGLLENEFFLIENHLNSGKTLRIHVIQINLDVSPGFARVYIKVEDEVNCKNWCNEISIPWNDLVGTTQKCDFTELCDGCPECVAPEAPDDYWIVCGKTNNCDPPSKKASADELHEVRCCSDTSKTGWEKKGSCDVWGESDLPECKHAETYESADQICKDNDARLCTKSELEGDCTAGSGCGHNEDHIWSSTLF
uniref:Peptidase M11 gametolysin domain-containing protein n=1 Tax=Eucampia antarctica TaxID=49252 RepID=A0A7S2RVQ4_9STRA